MTFTSVYYYIFVIILLLLYYVYPLRYRWIILLIGSLGFYYQLSKGRWWLFGLTLLVSYLAGIMIEKNAILSKTVTGGGLSENP